MDDVMKSDAQSMALLEQVVIGGDLSKLSPKDRLTYYSEVCRSVGLNPLTKPFEYITLNGKLVLYAKRDATDQLRALKGISIRIVSRELLGEIYVVTAQAKSTGREDESTGAVAIAGLKGADLANAYMKAECVPLDSDILTREGWMSYDQLTIGQEVLAYDVERNLSVWTPLRNVSVFKNAPVVRMKSEGEQFDVRCTPEHSWAVCTEAYSYRQRGVTARGPYKNRAPSRRLIKTNELNSAHRLILAAPAETTEDSILTPVEAAVLGWAVTDGTIQRRGSYIRVGVCQSKTENFALIEETMQMAAGHDVLRIESPGQFRTFPSGKTYECKPQSWWYLPSAVGRALLQKAGYQDRYDLPRIVTRLNRQARAAMLQAMMLAEGDKRLRFANGDKFILDAFELLCALQGMATGKRTPKDSVWTIRQKSTKRVAVVFLSRIDGGIADVWCPTTDFGTWVMRQNGRVMITGNTKAKRRVTLSIAGLGMLDESEVADVDPDTGSARELTGMDPAQYAMFEGEIADLTDRAASEALWKRIAAACYEVKDKAANDALKKAITAKVATLREKAA
jgi:hypothetical protein